MKHPKPAGKASAHKGGGAASSSADRNLRWESPIPATSPNPAPSGSPRDRPVHPSSAPPRHLPDGPPAPPSYGFHNLDRRTAILADGTARSYFALPPDYSNDPPPPERFLFHPEPVPEFSRRLPSREPPPLRRDPWGHPEPSPSLLKRKYEDDDEFDFRRQQVLQYGSYGNPNSIPSGSRGDFLGRRGGEQRGGEQQDDLRPVKQAKLREEGLGDLPHRRGSRDDDVPPPVAGDIDQKAVKRAFLYFVKMINENPHKKKSYLSGSGPFKCFVCDRASKDFTNVNGLIDHAYNSQNADKRVDHLGLHKALCVLMGWNYAAPDKSMSYKTLSDDDIAANRADLILWPPTVIIHNAITGKKNDGRMEGLGNRDMDIKLKELGFVGGKVKSMYGKEGHTGVTVVKFANTQAGLKEAERLAEYFEKENHGLKGWLHAEATSVADDNENPTLVEVDAKSGEKKRILYGYIATASDLEKLDQDMRKKVVIESRKEFDIAE